MTLMHDAKGPQSQQDSATKLQMQLAPGENHGERSVSDSNSDRLAADTSSSAPCIKIYGERNSGTIYLSELLRLNLRVQELRGFVPRHVHALQLLLPGREAVRDAWFARTFPGNLGWKHMRARPAAELAQHSIMSARVHFVTITKNPYSWLLSMHRRPYHQYYKKPLSFEEFLVAPWPTTKRDGTAKVVSSPVELWNLKNRSYLQLADGLPVINLRYEDLLEHPEEWMNRIQTQFSLERRAVEFQNYQQSTKDSDRDSQYYKDYYLKQRWRSKLSEEAITTINRLLDHDLRAAFGYEVVSEGTGL